MSLIIAFRNISALDPISDYDVTVWVNERQIDRGKVTGHARADGYMALVEKFVAQHKETPSGR